MKKIIAIPDTRAISKTGLANLKRFHDAAKSGELVSYAIIGVTKNGSYIRAWSQERGLPLIGAMEATKSEFIKDMG